MPESTGTRDRPSAITDPILIEGETCARIARAERAAMLVDGACYFRAVRAAILQARDSVLIAGWDIDSRVKMRAEPGDPGAEAPHSLRELLCYAVERQPQLQIRILLWDFTILFAADREPMPMLTLGWSTPPQIDLALDDELPAEASHHEKIIVVDDRVAFCGGMDLTAKRWDTPSHRVGDPDRVDSFGIPYEPFHDLGMMVDGEAARALGDVFRARWQNLTGDALPPVKDGDDPWPAFVTPDLRDVAVGIARTRAAHAGNPAVKEVERLHLRSIAAARRLVYIENQFVTADCVARALCDRLRAEPGLELILATSRRGHAWLEEQAMGAARLRFVRRLLQDGAPERTRCVYPALPSEGGRHALKVHSKAMFIDDRLVRIGSSNISNRSMGLDTECDLAIEAESVEHRAAIARMRNRLIAEHLGMSEDEVAAGLESHAGACAFIDSRADQERTLVPLERVEDGMEPLSEALGPIADPERPFDLAGSSASGPGSGMRGTALTLAGIVAAVLAIVLAWRYTPLSEIADIETVKPWFEAVRGSAWAPVVISAIYAAASLFVFPVTVLIAVTGIIFGPVWGFAYSLLGCLVGGAATFGVGVVFGRAVLERRLGAKAFRAVRFVRDKGVVAVALIRMVPVAPFSVVNMVAGAARVRFRDFMIGTALGMIPGITVMTALGDQFRRIWEQPDPTNITILAGLIVVWFGLTFLVQRLVARWRRKRA